MRRWLAWTSDREIVAKAEGLRDAAGLKRKGRLDKELGTVVSGEKLKPHGGFRLPIMD